MALSPAKELLNVFQMETFLHRGMSLKTLEVNELHKSRKLLKLTRPQGDSLKVIQTVTTARERRLTHFAKQAIWGGSGDHPSWGGLFSDAAAFSSPHSVANPSSLVLLTHQSSKLNPAGIIYLISC